MKCQTCRVLLVERLTEFTGLDIANSLLVPALVEWFPDARQHEGTTFQKKEWHDQMLRATNTYKRWTSLSDKKVRLLTPCGGHYLVGKTWSCIYVKKYLEDLHKIFFFLY